ncbi:hypothetical protein ACX80W_07225 [Arthrobacter sp. TMN-37]
MTSHDLLEVLVKKNQNTAPGFEEGVLAGIAAARGWAIPYVGAARGWATPYVGAAYGWTKPRWDKGVQTASPMIQESMRKAATGVSSGFATVTPMIQERLDRVGPRITEVIDTTTPRVQETLSKAGPALTSARGKVVDGYIPALSYKLGEAADSASRSVAEATIPPSVTSAVTRMTGNKKAARNAQKALVAAGMQASKELKKAQQSQSKKGKGWLIFGIIAAAVTAGVAAWRASKPVEDPWRTPAPVTPTPSTPTTPVTPATATTTTETTTTDAAATSGPDLSAASEQAEAVNKKVKDAPVDLSDTAKHAAKPGDAKS